MQCPGCLFENPPAALFCGECGRNLDVLCPQCRQPNPPVHRFCSHCGRKLHRVQPTDETTAAVQGERKHISAVFSDLCGYTALAETLDPEETKDLLDRIFRRVVPIIQKYDGRVEQLLGDGVLALFGVPQAHEDDALRAIMTAREIHQAVAKTGLPGSAPGHLPLAMHTGINTGLVVTGKSDINRGLLGVAGDAVNLASRLAQRAAPNEILVGPATRRQAMGHFEFDSLPPAKIRGKSQPILAYRVNGPKQRPVSIRGQLGLKAEFIGRQAELRRLRGALPRLARGDGTVFTIQGSAGAGKSRLIQEFKTILEPLNFRWLESHAFPYAQGIPYYPLMDLLGRILKIGPDDSAAQAREKIESGISNLVGAPGEMVEYIGSLYSLDSRETKAISPQLWHAGLRRAIARILSALFRQAPTVLSLEDFHWADRSSVDLFRTLLPGIDEAAVVMCAYRPPFRLFTRVQLDSLKTRHREIHLGDLSPVEAQRKIESLLETSAIPPQLQRLVREKAGGNPFYLEEVVSSLRESQTLTRKSGIWRIDLAFRRLDVPSTARGVISARVDRLDSGSKQALQEAALIGRRFKFDILKRITRVKIELQTAIGNLQRLDLIHTRSLLPELEFAFKHGLTQEVAYRGMLKKTRLEIHERIARVMEKLYAGRLSEHTEALAYHYARGKTLSKAVDYLIRSGGKSLKHHALGDSRRYFRQAYDLLTAVAPLTPEQSSLLLKVVNRWAFVFYYLGDNRGLGDLLQKHRQAAETATAGARRGMFYAWLGCVSWHRGMFSQARGYLKEAIDIAERSRAPEVTGYASAWLCWVMTELGHSSEALENALRAQELWKKKGLDHYVHFNALAGQGYAHWHRGEKKETLAVGAQLLGFGKRHKNLRSTVLGHCCLGWGYLVEGDLSAARQCFKQAVKISVDPWYAQFPKLALCYGQALAGADTETEDHLRRIVAFSRRTGTEFIGAPAKFLESVVRLPRGNHARELEKMTTQLDIWRANKSRLRYASCAHILAQVYAALARSPDKQKSIGSSHKINAPAVSAARYFKQSIDMAQRIGARGVLGRAYLNRGMLEIFLGQPSPARRSLNRAIEIFNKCQAQIYRRQALEALKALSPAATCRSTHEHGY